MLFDFLCFELFNCLLVLIDLFLSIFKILCQVLNFVFELLIFFNLLSMLICFVE